MADDDSVNPGPDEQDAPLSQDDIDAALAADDAPGTPQAASPPDSTEADADAAVGATEGPANAEAAPAAGDSAAVSQADIDALMAGGSGGPAEETPAANSEPLDQAEIDAALAGQGGSDAGPADEPDERLDSSGRPFDAAAAAMAAAIEEEKAAAAEGPQQPAGEPVELPDFAATEDDQRLNHDIDLLHNVNLQVKIELGRTRMLVEDVLRLGEGSVVELDKLAGDPVDVFANERLIARGEVLVFNDNFCVRVSEILSGQPEGA